MQARQLRRAVATLATRANDDLSPLWSRVSTPDQARDALAEVLPALVVRYGPAAATVAAVFYDEMRAQRHLPGRFAAVPVDLGEAGAVALAGWGVGPLYAAEPDWAAARTLVAGGLQRRIANFSRQTVTTASVEDPRARGWTRVGSGECGYCQDRLTGAVVSEASADFEAHDHCNCHAEPSFT